MNIRRHGRAETQKLKAVEYMGGKCHVCGYDRCVQALEFHHRDPMTKHTNFNSKKYWSWERLVAELAKCVMLCANCHREVEHGVIAV